MLAWAALYVARIEYERSACRPRARRALMRTSSYRLKAKILMRIASSSLTTGVRPRRRLEPAPLGLHARERSSRGRAVPRLPSLCDGAQHSAHCSVVPQAAVRGYQHLAGAEGPLAAMSALDTTLDDARKSLGVATDFVDFVGFAGGAQFIHRYAMLAPARVLRLVVVSAGWYTYLDRNCRFPHGSGPSAESGGLPIHGDTFLRLPIRVIVGERDIERDDSLRTSKRLDRWQGPHRLERARRWVADLEKEAHTRGITPRVTLEVLPDTGTHFMKP